MKILFFLSITIIIGEIIFAIFTVSTRKKYSKIILRILIILLVLALTIIAYYIDPDESTDLYRHFQTIKAMRVHDNQITTSVDNLLFIKLLFKIVAKIGNVYLLPVITTVIVYSIFLVIFIKNLREISTLQTWHIIIIFMALCSYFYVATGIKNTLAFAILALGIFFENNNKKLIGKVLILLAIFTHGSTLFVVMLYYFTKKATFMGRIKYIILLIPLTTEVIINILNLIPVPIIQYVVDKLILYKNISDFSGNNNVLYINIIYNIIIAMRCSCLLKKQLNSKQKELILLINVFSLFALGSIFLSKEIIGRIGYLLAFLMIELIQAEDEVYNIKQKVATLSIDIIYSIGMISYYFVMLLSHTNFRIG